MDNEREAVEMTLSDQVKKINKKREKKGKNNYNPKTEEEIKKYRAKLSIASIVSSQYIHSYNDLEVLARDGISNEYLPKIILSFVEDEDLNGFVLMDSKPLYPSLLWRSTTIKEANEDLVISLDGIEQTRVALRRFGDDQFKHLFQPIPQPSMDGIHSIGFNDDKLCRIKIQIAVNILILIEIAVNNKPKSKPKFEKFNFIRCAIGLLLKGERERLQNVISLRKYDSILKIYDHQSETDKGSVVKIYCRENITFFDQRLNVRFSPDQTMQIILNSKNTPTSTTPIKNESNRFRIPLPPLLPFMSLNNNNNNNILPIYPTSNIENNNNNNNMNNINEHNYAQPMPSNIAAFTESPTDSKHTPINPFPLYTIKGNNNNNNNNNMNFDPFTMSLSNNNNNNNILPIYPTSNIQNNNNNNNMENMFIEQNNNNNNNNDRFALQPRAPLLPIYNNNNMNNINEHNYAQPMSSNITAFTESPTVYPLDSYNRSNAVPSENMFYPQFPNCSISPMTTISPIPHLNESAVDSSWRFTIYYR